jgi:hypothetical protein
VFWQIVIMIACYVISAAMAPKQRPPKPAAFEDFDFPQADEGTPQMIVFGDVWITDWMVIGLGNFRTEAIRKSGGKK